MRRLLALINLIKTMLKMYLNSHQSIKYVKWFVVKVPFQQPHCFALTFWSEKQTANEPACSTLASRCYPDNQPQHLNVQPHHIYLFLYPFISFCPGGPDPPFRYKYNIFFVKVNVLLYNHTVLTLGLIIFNAKRAKNNVLGPIF